MSFVGIRAAAAVIYFARSEIAVRNGAVPAVELLAVEPNKSPASFKAQLQVLFGSFSNDFISGTVRLEAEQCLTE